ncbi:MAG: beta strand repeat-containing protein [Pikeienuella sp.]
MAIFEFTAIRGDVLSQNPLDVGSAFTMPLGAELTLSISDGDAILSGDLFRNEIGDDNDQTLLDDSQGNGGVLIYAERRLIVQDASGARFTLIELETEFGADAQSARLYTFDGPVPAQNAVLNVVEAFNAIGDVASFDDLSAGISFVPNGAGEITLEAEDLSLNGYVTVPQGNASGNEVISLAGATGTASFLFGGAELNYTILIDLVDVVGGEGEVALFVNNQLLTSVVLDFATDEGGGDRRLTIAAPETLLSEGDVIEIRGTAGDDDLATVDRIVFVVNGAPTAVPDLATITEDETVVVNVLENDDDPDNGPLFLVDVEGVTAHDSGEFQSDGGRTGRISVMSGGGVTFETLQQFDDLAPGETDFFVFNYTIVDDQGGTATSTLTINITGVNDAPVAEDFVGQTDEDQALDGQLVAFDAEGDNLTFALNSGASNGIVTVNDDGTFTFEPDEDFSGDDSFTFSVFDGVETVVGNAAITVGPLNDAPVIDQANSDTSFSFTEDELENGVQGPNATSAPAAPTWGGGDVGQSDAEFLRDNTPAEPSSAVAPLQDRASVGIILFDDADATDQHVAEVVNVATSGAVADFSAIDFASLFVIDQVDSVNGTVIYTLTASVEVIEAANSLAANEVAEVQYTIRISDNGDPSLFDETVVSMTLTGSNDAPEAAPGNFNVLENGVLSDQLVAVDVDGDALTFALDTGPSLGDVVINQDGTFTYTPIAGFDGEETFTFTVTDGLETITQFATVFVDPVNDAPTAVNDVFQGNEDNVIVDDVINGSSGIDIDIDGDLLTVVAVEGQALVSGQTITLVSGALLTMNDDGTFVYDPNGQFEAASVGDTEVDGFTYTVSDGQLSSQASVTLNIAGVNDVPIAVADTFSVGANDQIVENILVNDLDVDGSFLEVITGGDVSIGLPLFLTTDGGRAAFFDIAADGSLFFDASGEFEDLSEGETDSVSFTYVARDEDGGVSDPATVTVTIQGENDAPEIDPVDEDQVATLLEDSDVPDQDGFVRTNATVFFFDPDLADTHTPAVDNVIESGTVIAGFDAANALTVTNAGFGSAEFTFAIDDALFQTLGAGEQATFVYDLSITDSSVANPLSDTTTFTVNLVGVNDAPVADDLAVSGNEDTDITGTLTASDVDGDAITFSENALPANGVVVINSNGTFTYTPDANFNGTDTFTFFADDGVETSTATVTVTVAPVNDAPEANSPEVVPANSVVTFGLGSGTIDNTNDGAQHAVAALLNGGFVTVDRQGAGEASGLTIFDAAGSEIATTEVSETVDSSNDAGQSVAVLSNGDIVALTVESRNTLIARVFNADGTAQSVDFIVDDNNSTFIDGSPSIAATTDGGFVVVWGGNVNDPQLGTIDGIFARRFDAGGTETQGTLRLDNVNTPDANHTDVVALASGGFAAGYLINDQGSLNAHLTIVDAAGGIVAQDIVAEVGVITGNGARPSVTELADGSIVMAYEGLSSEGGATGFFSIFAPNGTLLSGPTQAVDFAGGNALDGQRDIDVLGLPNGGFVVAFANDRFGATNNVTGEAFPAGIIIQQFDAFGQPVGEPDQIATGQKPELALTPEGNVVLVSLATNNRTVIREIELENNPFTVPEDDFLILSGLSVSDVDIPPGGGEIVVATLSVVNGTLEASQGGAATIAGNQTDTLSITGTIDEINAELETVLYVPTPDFNGDDTLTFEVTDAGGLSDLQTITISVTPVNDAPTANDETVSGDEDQVITGAITANDLDGDALTFSVLFEGDFLSTVIDPVTGAFTITPDANFNGTDTANILIDDGNGGTVTADIFVTINPVNDAPIANDDTAATDQDTVVGANLISGGPGGDFDPDFNGLTLTEINGAAIVDGQTITLASGALITVNTDGTYSYDPNAQFDDLAGGGTPETATDIITYTVSDGALTDEGQLTVTISGLNDAPVAVADAVSALEDDGAVTENVVANDIDIDGDVLTIIDGLGDVQFSTSISITTSGGRLASFDTDAGGNVTLNLGTTFDDLAQGDVDSVDFVYFVEDQDGLQSSAIATFQITGENDAPVAADDNLITDEDTALSGDLFADNSNGADQDIDNTFVVSAVEGQAGAVGTAFSLASGALLTVNADGTFDYDPNGQFEGLNVGQQGTDSFTYTIDDGFTTSTATATVTIDGVNDNPVAINDTFTVNEDVAGTSDDLIANDLDAEGQTLLLVDGGGDVTLSDTFIITSAGGRDAEIFADASGLVSFDGLGAFEELGAGESDTVTFTYQVEDTEFGTSNTATVEYTITGENDAVQLLSSATESSTVDQNTPNDTIFVLFNEIDLNDVVTLTLVGSASTGDETAAFAALDLDSLITITDSGSDFVVDFAIDTNDVIGLSGAEAANFEFDFLLEDGNGGSEAISYSVVVNGLNDTPTIDPLAISTDEDQSVSGQVVFDDIDENDVPTTSLGLDGANGTAIVNADGTFTYTPNADFAGVDTFDVEVSDGNGGLATETVTVTVNPINDAPTAATASALRFDGTDTQRVDVAHNALLSPATDFTVEAVISTTDDTAGLHRVLRKGVGGGQTYSISVENGDAVFRADNGVQGFAINGGPVADGLPHTISVTVEGPTNIVTIYVDGVETATQTLNGTLLQGTETLEIGQTTAAGNQDFEGDIHEIRFFNEVRDAATIAANDDAVLDPAGEDALQLYLTFEGDVTDSSGNAFDGSIFGSPEFVEGAAAQDGTIIGFEDSTIPVAGILVDDVDIDFDSELSGAVEITLTVTDGVVSVGDIQLVTITGGADGSASVTFEMNPLDRDAVMGSIVFIPDADFNGTASLTATIDDLGQTGAGGAQTGTVTVPIIVTNENDAPIVDDLSVSGDEDTDISGQVTFTDIDGDALTFSLDSDGLNGTAVVNSDGTFTYTPNADFNGTDTFTVIGDDGNGGDDTALVTVTVDPVNDAPVAPPLDAGTQTEDTPESVDLLTNAVEIDSGDVLSIGADIKVTNIAGDTITFTIVDEFLTIDPGQFDGLAVGETDTVTISYDVTDGNTVSDNASGAQSIPNAGFFFVIDFDTGLASSVARVIGGNPNAPADIGVVNGVVLAINPNNDEWVADAHAYENSVESVLDPAGFEIENYGGAQAIVGDFIQFDDTTTNATLTFRGENVPTPQGLQLVTATFTNVNFTDGSGVVTIDSADITVESAASTTASFEVTGVNDAPTAVADAFTVNEDAVGTSEDLLANDFDPEGDSLEIIDGGDVSLSETFIITSAGGRDAEISVDATGIASFDGLGNFENLADGETDTLTFTYQVQDVNGEPAAALETVTYTVTGENDDVTLDSDPAPTITTDEDFVADTQSVSFTEIDTNDTVTLTLVSATSNGDETAALAALDLTTLITITAGEGDFQIDFLGNTADFDGLSAGFAAILDFSFELSDGIATETVDYSVEIFGVNEAPVADDASVTTLEDTAVTDFVVVTDIDEQDLLAFSISAQGTNGVASIDSVTGEFTYTPDADFFGIDTFTYQVADGNGGVDTGTITVTVDNVLDPVNAVAMSAVQAGGNGSGFIINGIAAGDQAGVSVAHAGDVNGDGLDDIIVGAYLRATANGASSGQSYVIFGKADGAVVNLSDIDADIGVGGFAIDGATGTPRSGYSVSGAGDINGDGLDDLLISSYQAAPNGANSGQAFVIFGKPADTNRVDTETLAAGEGFEINGIAAQDFAGLSVSTISDVNGDGFDDLIVSSPFADVGGGTDEGRVHVVFGKADDAAVELSAVVPAAGLGFEIIGATSGERIGSKVSNAGDFNNDGIEDIILGSQSFDGGGGAEGRAYLVFGKADDAQIDVATIAAGAGGGIAIDAAAVGDNVGVSVSNAGDFNGDGIDDIIIGASGVDTNGADAGAAYIIFGRVGGALTPIDLSTLGAADGLVINGAEAGDNIGKSVSSAGDVNGDGFEDVIIGGNGIDDAAVNSGGAFVVFGTASTATIELSAIEGGAAGGFAIEGVDGGDFTGGNDIAGGGDINGDGFDDLIVSAKNAGGAVGETTVIFGGELIGASEANIVGDAAANTLSGSDFDDRIIAGAGDDTIDAGGGDDIIAGGAGSDVFIFNNGDGNDVIRGFGDISDPGQDIVEIADFGFLDFAAVQAALSTEGLNTRLALDADDSILFLDRGLNSFVSAEFDLGSA